jgi:hypothetical protein
MALHRRTLLAVSGAGVVSALAGCLPGQAQGHGSLTIGTAHPEPQTLQIEVAPDYEAERVFTETITVTENATPIEREEVVAGRNGEEFYVEVSQETQDETFETVWELNCAAADRPDRLDVTVTEWGDVRFSQNRCGSGFEDSPSESPTG